jgi:predicted PurR-regulated permease PerM
VNFPPPTEKQARILWLSLTLFASALLVSTLVLLVWGLGWVLRLLSPVLWPLAIAGVLAYLLDPVVDFLQRKRLSRARAILSVFGIGLVLMGAFLASVVPRLVGEASDLVEAIPKYSHEIQSKAREWTSNSRWLGNFFAGHPAKVTEKVIEPATNRASNVSFEPALATNTVAPLDTAGRGEAGWEKKLAESALNWVAATLPKLGTWLLDQLHHAASWAGFLIGFVMVPVFTYYFLQEKEGIRLGWTNYLPVHESKFKTELVFVLNAINDYLIVFFRGQVLIALCDAVMLTIGFLFMGLNYGVLFGVAAGLLGIVPYLGTIVTIVPAMIVAAVQFTDWWHPLEVLVVYSLVHLVEGFVISPKIMGDRVGLHPLTIIVAVLIGTTLLGGILGGILAIPLTAALRVVMFRYVWKTRTA